MVKNGPRIDSFYYRFVASKPVEGFEDGMLEMTFVELRQVNLPNLLPHVNNDNNDDIS